MGVELTDFIKKVLFPHKTPTMQLFVQGAQLHNVEVSTEAEFFAFVQENEGNCDNLTFSMNGAPVESFDQLNEGCTVTVTGKLLGGKVNGQTPKVEPSTEKKKPKTGRARRRMQYNRRFVTETAAFGKKKGPNCQEK